MCAWVSVHGEAGEMPSPLTKQRLRQGLVAFAGGVAQILAGGDSPGQRHNGREFAEQSTGVTRRQSSGQYLAQEHGFAGRDRDALPVDRVECAQRITHDEQPIWPGGHLLVVMAAVAGLAMHGDLADRLSVANQLR